MLKVNRASYYRWLSPTKSKRSIENEDLKKRISKIYFNEGERVYGADKIHSSLKIELEKIGRICSIKRVQRLMRKLNLRSITRKKWKPTITSKGKVEDRENLLNQDFSTTTLNQKWVTDITYIETKKDGWCYLSTIMDLHSKRIIGYSFGKKMDTDLVLRTLGEALKNREINSKLILHSDLGSQYTSKAYEKALNLNNIQHSFSRKGCPYDNAGIESFHASLKKERVYQQEVYPDFETAKLDIFDYVFRFYNRKRIHGSIGYLTPVGFEELINGAA